MKVAEELVGKVVRRKFPGDAELIYGIVEVLAHHSPIRAKTILRYLRRWYGIEITPQRLGGVLASLEREGIVCGIRSHAKSWRKIWSLHSSLLTQYWLIAGEGGEKGDETREVKLSSPPFPASSR